MTTVGAILLAGGRASRVEGAVKPLFEVDGRSLLARGADAVAGSDPVTVVGPVLDPALSVQWVREDPPFGGPAAAIVAALQSWAVDPEWTVVLACDLPEAELAVARLRRDVELLPADTDGLCLGDVSSRPQWLTGIYRTAALRRAARELPHAHGASVRDLLAELAIAVVAAPVEETSDIDTWEDLSSWRERSVSTDAVASGPNADLRSPATQSPASEPPTTHPPTPHRRSTR